MGCFKRFAFNFTVFTHSEQTFNDVASASERSGVEVFCQGTFGISKRSRKKRSSRAEMRLKVGFSFPPMSTSIRPAMQEIVGFAQLSSHRTRQRHLGES